MNLVSSADVARELRVSRKTVTRLVESGDLTPVVRGPGLRGAFLFDPADIEALVAERGAHT
ncbi:helix-turn-helix domain-containing protein [Rhodococcus tibetensis]|uniref:Helix-turn-helix domain-containing protein n=1 Tax=Rhodococcus tibetensis TaxID=2965064 RepID=A0ABT1QFH4_9NOCA|nr:helix-turn-helix domain-containing protein [Rhodococcus sp. FXJ9.536]MCQ4120418.1 helix-turn-helix domain-containing protein [Rhodococcus sp. FXJ9.536]